MLIHIIAGIRPNFIKIAPLYYELIKDKSFITRIIHTGQHYDSNMSGNFFRDLNLPAPDINLGIGGGTHAEQTGKIMIAYEKIILDEKPDLIIVVGDANSTMAAALAAVKLQIPIGHLEAGLRSNDRAMPEEINRIVTDSFSDILWTPSADADENLKREGISEKRIHFVGNIMIDSLELNRDIIEKQYVYKDLGLQKNSYALVTLHRPSNVDSKERMICISKKLKNISKHLPIVFLVHPRTLKRIREYDLPDYFSNNNIIVTDPMNYLRFMNLVLNARIVITDSGGLQEETSYLGISCLTLRPNTERPVTVYKGTNHLCEIENLENIFLKLISGNRKKQSRIEFWDGKTAKRVVINIKEFRSGRKALKQKTGNRYLSRYLKGNIRSKI